MPRVERPGNQDIDSGDEQRSPQENQNESHLVGTRTRHEAGAEAIHTLELISNDVTHRRFTRRRYLTTLALVCPLLSERKGGGFGPRTRGSSATLCCEEDRVPGTNWPCYYGLPTAPGCLGGGKWVASGSAKNLDRLPSLGMIMNVLATVTMLKRARRGCRARPVTRERPGPCHPSHTQQS